jgi:hypothetical protein
MTLRFDSFNMTYISVYFLLTFDSSTKKYIPKSFYNMFFMVHTSVRFCTWVCVRTCVCAWECVWTGLKKRITPPSSSGCNGFMHTNHSHFILEGVADIWDIPPTFYQNDSDMKNYSDLKSGKPIAVWSLFISSASAVYPLVAFYNIQERKGEVSLFCSVPHTKRNPNQQYIYSKIK